MLCPFCDDAVLHFGHCPRCHGVRSRLAGACPKCGADLNALFDREPRSNGGL
jgi:hypothetical protein